MTETLTGKQVLALLAQDEPPKIEYIRDGKWADFKEAYWGVYALRTTETKFRIKPTPARRLSVTLSNGEVVSWPEPVREALECDKEYWWCIDDIGDVAQAIWDGDGIDLLRLAFGNVHLTREDAQEHTDALRRINTQGVA